LLSLSIIICILFILTVVILHILVLGSHLHTVISAWRRLRNLDHLELHGDVLAFLAFLTPQQRRCNWTEPVIELVGLDALREADLIFLDTLNLFRKQPVRDNPRRALSLALQTMTLGGLA